MSHTTSETNSNDKMNEERFKEFKNELKMLGKKELSFVDLSVWFQQWAVYISKGGVRPPRPH